ncbi:diguanylate cyclase (GGDEF)-like protein/PAS domain S-box-containing protein [Natronocella acetinitrilica]|uniref:cyclic-guanylate-specific phosphodiesterase n=2 Tax=Natronocella acetinitrilica TaxID=414046 RepID=A0AAE3G4H6_9GAMM|nr:diguanylate cyclase (GGDEF)-like protein/PAS domain S-box-containing protein [Natronocella acetinitrilica]
MQEWAAAERILVVDHQPRLLDSLRLMAAGHELPLDAVETEGEARSHLASGAYGVLVVDLLHPEQAGQRLLQQIRADGLDIHVVVATSDSSQEAAVRALRGGARDFLRKPYAPEELLLTLRNALEHRRLSRENQRFQSRLRRSQQLYRFIVERSPDVIYVLDQQGNFTFVNAAVERMLGYPPEALLGRHYSVIVSPDDVSLARHGMDDRRTGDRATRNLEVRLLKSGDARPENRAVTVEVSAMGIYGQSGEEREGEFLGTYGVVRDITERKHAEALIRYQAHHDLLTGLPNRALFKDRLRAGLARNQRSEERLAVLFLDLDRFKLVNDSMGHSFGDRLLECVARRLRECLREGDTLARLGGDEFTILLPAIQRDSDPISVADKCIAAMREPFYLDQQEIYLGVSIGIAQSPEHGETVEALIKHADVAMYHAKEDDRRHVAVFESFMSQRVDQHVSIESGLRQAIAQNQLNVLYQPQIDVASGRITAMEALIRWRHPTLGTISPLDFIPVAEQTGSIIPISQWLLRTACQDMLRWPGGSESGTRLAVNLSPVQLEHADFVKDTLRILHEVGFPPHRLEFEITEHLLMRDLESVVTILRKLSAHGITFAVDDFGTGYSSLSYLQRLPIHTLKIDQSFVRSLQEGREEGHLVGAIVSMGRSLGLKIVAEGVETQAQLDMLRRLKCNEMQGYLFSRPQAALDLSGEAVERWRSAVHG